MAYVNVCISKSLKEELAWATDERLQVISNTMLVKTVISLRNSAVRYQSRFAYHNTATVASRYTLGIEY